jgi:YcxB-like protein
MAKGYSSQGHGGQRRMVAAPSNPLAIKTKKYAFEKNKFISLSMWQLIRTQWYWGFVPLAIILVNVILNLTKVYPNYWIYVLTLIGVILYVIFWAIQFTGVTQLEQYKQLFGKYRYEIDSKQILMRISETEGGVVKWDMVQSAQKDKEAYIFTLGKFQFLYLPFSIFTSDNDRKLMDRILKEKNLISE